MENPQLQLLPAHNPPRPTQLPVRLVANPNNKTTWATYNIDVQKFPKYLISTVPFQGVQLGSRRDLSQKISPITIEEEPKPNPNPSIEDNALNKDNIYVLTEQPPKEQLQVTKAPPYLERLAL